MNWHVQVQQLVGMIDKGEIIGSKAALARIRKSRVAAFVGTNLLGDECFDLGRLPREHCEKRLYLHPFTRPNASGAKYRATVQAKP